MLKSKTNYSPFATGVCKSVKICVGGAIKPLTLVILSQVQVKAAGQQTCLVLLYSASVLCLLALDGLHG